LFTHLIHNCYSVASKYPKQKKRENQTSQDKMLLFTSCSQTAELTAAAQGSEMSVPMNTTYASEECFS